MGEPSQSLKKQRIGEQAAAPLRPKYETPGRECIAFFEVRTAQELADATNANMPDPPLEESTTGPSKNFTAEFTVFLLGEEEILKGYESPQIRCYFNAWDLSSAVDVRFASKQVFPPHKIEDVLPLGFPTSKTGRESIEQMGAAFPESRLSIADFGGVLEGAPEGVSLTRASLAKGGDAVKGLHARFEQFMFFFIDGLTQIDTSDLGWEVIFAWVKEGDSLLPAGIATVFRHFAYPDRVRIKLSQLFVLPPHRGKGIAAALVRAAIKAAEDDPEVVDFTVEDPVPVVSRIRDVHDLRRCMDAKWPVEAAEAAGRAFRDTIKSGEQGSSIGGEDATSSLLLPSWVASRMQKELKISPKQASNVWEALLRVIDGAADSGGAGTGEEGGQAREASAGLAESLVRRKASMAQTKALSTASGKTIVETGESGFVMCKGGKGQPVELGEEAEKGLGEEELEEQVAARLAVLESVVEKATGGQ